MDFANNEFIKVRIQKIEELRNLEKIVYKNKFEKDGNIEKIASCNLGENVSAAGRIISIREFGKLIFFHIQDFSGKIQVAIDAATVGEEKLNYFKKFVDIADFIGVKGQIILTKTGEKTIQANSFILLSKAIRPLPEKWHGIADTETKYRQRYLDLVINPDSMKRFLKRSKLISTIRNFLENNQFIEVETPILQNKKSGALAKPFVTHHTALDTDLFLRISPETYLKRCIAGGFDRVYEFAKSFRNEGIDPSHLQEFTLLEFYAAYWDYRQLMKFTQQLIQHSILTMNNSMKITYKGQEIDFSGEWPIYSFRELLIQHADIDINKFPSAESLRAEIKRKGIQIEDIDKLGRGNLIDQLYKKVARPKMINPQFLINHPIDLSPLARKSDNNDLETDRFQLVVNTWEIVNAYSELVDPLDQRQRFEQQAKAHAEGDEDALEMDEDFCLCVDHGLPPIAGWGMGIDRFMALITDCENLKDVVLFPLMRPIESEDKEDQKFPNLIKASIDRKNAFEFLKKNISSDSLIKHSLASAAVMEGLAEYFNQDKDNFYIAGLLHDIDFEMIDNKFELHGIQSMDLLKPLKLDENILHAIQSHNEEFTKIKRTNNLDFALTAAESVTGLISATALILPSKKLADVQVESVIKRMKKKDFAKNVNRESIILIEKTGLKLEKFVEIAINSMQKIATELGL